MQTFLVLISLIIISYLFTYFLKTYLKIPKVVSLIILGVIFGSTNFGIFFIGESKYIIGYLGHIGIFSLMFLAGLESSYKTLLKEEHDALEIALFGSLFTLFSSFIVFLLLGFSFIESFIIGLCLSITAEGTKARVLLECNKIKTKVASAMLGAGIIDDVLGLALFSGVLFFIGSVDFREHLLLIGILISFVLGLLAQHFFAQHHLTKKTELVLNNFFIPFFFISMGLNFNISELLLDPKLFFIMFVVGTLGKLIGTLLSKSHTTFSYSQLYLIGWGMNSRGAIEIALALVALHASLISENIFSALVLTALVPTLLFPFILEYLIKKNPKIMN
ncbi:MAG: cation:proton antiporter [Nanoarchaeota archaeon]|nr:cation:proton antiporter [Nanoarchaeota archaeon]